MRIFHKKDDFLYTIFPNLTGGGKILIVNELKRYYAYGASVPKITIDGDWIIVEINTQTIEAEEAEYQKVIDLCDNGHFNTAKPLLKNLIKGNPTNSEYHRILGQIKSEQGRQEEAINHLIDALRWNPKNGWALVMMGNIFNQHKNDFSTAIKYYEQARIANPDDYITNNNIGSVLLKEGKLEEAKRFLKQVIEHNNYPNAYYGLGLAADQQHQHQEAFLYFIEALRYNPQRDQLYNNSAKLAINMAHKVLEEYHSEIIDTTVLPYLNKLEESGSVAIELIKDNNIPVAATLQMAENYNRTKHRVVYKPNLPAAAHLLMHELKHYDLMIEARKVNKNQLFTSNDSHRRTFIEHQKAKINQLRKKGIPQEEVIKFMNSLFDGINLQAYNTPIDLYIEHSIYKEKNLRPFQFISLYQMAQNNVASINNEQLKELAPRSILRANKIYNIVTALQLKELYGIDTINAHNPSPNELREAEELYEEFLQFKDNPQPGEEYRLVLDWADDLDLTDYFELVDEETYRNKRTNMDHLLTSIEEDPYDTNSNDLYKEKAMEQFQKSSADPAAKAATTMHMINALSYFEGQTTDKIRATALEIAILGTQGIRPDQDNYSVNSIPNRTFTGQQMLAYYYVSWALSAPDMVDQLQLPYKEEYEVAQQLYQSDK